MQIPDVTRYERQGAFMVTMPEGEWVRYEQVAALKAEVEKAQPKYCRYGDPTCPCQDGDPCHYEGKNPWTPPIQMLEKVKAELAQLQQAREELASALRRM